MRKRRLKIFKIFALINIILLVFNIVSYFLITGPSVIRSQAAGLSMSLLVNPAPPIQPEPPTPEPPNQYNPPQVEPEPEQEFPVWLTIDQVNDQYLSDLTFPYQFTEQILTFRGQTNIIDAIVFIQLNDQPEVIYTTWSENGFWQWTTPYSLNFTAYEIYVWAISPADPDIIAEKRVEFQIVKQIIPPAEPAIPPAGPKEPEPPIPPPLPKEPKEPIIIYPKIVPKEIYLKAKEFYNLSIKVLNENHQIYPKEKVVLRTDLFKLKPQEEKEIEIKYTIFDNENKKILETSRQVKVIRGISFIQNFLTTFNIKPGKYLIEARIERDDKIFVANDYFLVVAKPLFLGARELEITQQELAQALVISFLLLLIILIIFILLLIREYQKSLKEKHISEKDLKKKDYLDLGLF